MYWMELVSPVVATAFVATRRPAATAINERHVPQRQGYHLGGGSSSSSSSTATRFGSVTDSPQLMTWSQAVEQSKYDDLLEWIKFKGQGAEIHPAIKIAPSGLGGGYGVFVIDSVSKGDLLFLIPRSACVTLEDATLDPISGPAFKKLIEKAGPGGNTVCLAGFLARERLRSLQHKTSPETISDSSFGPYLETLPWERGINNQEHTLYWEKDLVDRWLTGTMCYAEVTALRDEVDLAITVLNGIIGGTVRELRGEQPSSQLKGFLWPWEAAEARDRAKQIVDGLPQAVKGAFVSLLTRAFQDGDENKEKLVPLLDILQHSDEPNISHVMVKETGAVRVVARTDLAAGQELFNQYRSEMEESMPYHRFFTRFGFVPGVMEQDVEALLREKSPIFFAQKAEV